MYTSPRSRLNACSLVVMAPRRMPQKALRDGAQSLPRVERAGLGPQPLPPVAIVIHYNPCPSGTDSILDVPPVTAFAFRGKRGGEEEHSH
jgi:hypothetical protein